MDTNLTQAPSSVLRSGVCALCRGAVSNHFDANNRFIGCGKMPRLRKSDTLFIPPIFVTPEMLGIKTGPAATFREAAERKHRGRPPKVVVTASETETPASGRKRSVAKEVKGQTSEAPAVAAASDSSKRRGRVPGRYVPTGKEPSKVRTDAVMSVFRLIKGHKRGMAAKDIAERLEMPLGTVGWAMRWLVKQHAAEYQAAA